VVAVSSFEFVFNAQSADVGRLLGGLGGQVVPSGRNF
jgi:hypothetical protein